MKNVSLVVLAASFLVACGGAQFNGKVVSCADQKPLPDASLKWESTDKTNNNMAGLMPSKTKADGTYQGNVTLAQNASVMLTVDKDGYEQKQETLTQGGAQTICLAPKK